jgi:hypothetical protein
MVWIKTPEKQRWLSNEDDDSISRQEDANKHDEGGREGSRQRKQRHHEEGRHSDLGFD